MSILVATGITKYYGDWQVLKAVNITVVRGEVVSIMGDSGAGKTTLLHILATIDYPDKGKLYFNNEDILVFNKKRLAVFRNKNIGFVFQFHNLFPEFTAFENICIPGYLGGFRKSIVEERGKELLALLQMTHRSDYKPDMLSGGEKQRVAIARALINSPEIVLADEPSGSLDSKNAINLHELFLGLRNTLGQTFIFVTHNQQFADIADRKLIMKDGILN